MFDQILEFKLGILELELILSQSYKTDLQVTIVHTYKLYLRFIDIKKRES